MDFDYDALAVLSAVVRTGSFESAAKSLNVTQSAVSQRIKQLEDKVGSILIIRGRPCVATEDGLLLCQHIEQVALMRHEVSEQLNGSAGQSAGKVRIAVNSDSLATWFPEVIAQAATTLNLRLEIVPEDQEFTEDRLRSGDALAIITSSDNQIPGCQIFPLGDMQYTAIASPEFMANHFAQGVTLASATSAPSIRFDRKDTLPYQWLDTAFGETNQLKSHYVPSFEGHLVCCRKGTGWAMMPTESVADYLRSGELVELIPDIYVNTPLFWHTRSQSSGALKRLSELVIAVSGEKLLNNAKARSASPQDTR